MKIRIGLGLGAATDLADGATLGHIVDELERLGFDSLWFTERVNGREPRFVPLRRNDGRNPSVYDVNLRARKALVLGKTAAALFLEVFNLLNTDDLRIFSYQPSLGDRFDPSPTNPAPLSPLQVDATRRFGRRFQVGFQIDF